MFKYHKTEKVKNVLIPKKYTLCQSLYFIENNIKYNNFDYETTEKYYKFNFDCRTFDSQKLKEKKFNNGIKYLYNY